MKRNLLAVLLVLPLIALAARTSPASGLPAGSVNNRVCGIGAFRATCTVDCCNKAGVVVSTFSFAQGQGSTCGAAVDACLNCPSCGTLTHCGGTSSCP